MSQRVDDPRDDTLCPIAHSTGLVGDRWSILIVRELLLGQSRFQDLQAQTGATSQMLAARLKRLEADGLVERRAYSQRPVRYEYRLTQKGSHLMPVILGAAGLGRALVQARRPATGHPHVPPHMRDGAGARWPLPSMRRPCGLDRHARPAERGLGRGARRRGADFAEQRRANPSEP
jgi:DNA-binding HxlR family transcriptional regulator